MEQTRDLQQPTLTEISPSTRSFTYGSDFSSISYSGSGNVTAKLIFVNSGCSALDYESAGFQDGQIALALLTSECRTSDRAGVASAMKVGGLMIYNNLGELDRADILKG